MQLKGSHGHWLPQNLAGGCQAFVFLRLLCCCHSLLGWFAVLDQALSAVLAMLGRALNAVLARVQMSAALVHFLGCHERSCCTQGVAAPQRQVAPAVVTV